MSRGSTRLRWKTGRFVAAVVMMATVASLGIYQVRERYRVVELGYSIGESRFEHQRLLEQEKRLRLALATYKDPVAVRKLAREHLEMKEAEPRDELIVPDVESVPAIPLERLLPLRPESPGGSR